ncbi:hypothetical protein RKD19_002463 [Streptomyces canus]
MPQGRPLGASRGAGGTAGSRSAGRLSGAAGAARTSSVRPSSAGIAAGTSSPVRACGAPARLGPGAASAVRSSAGSPAVRRARKRPYAPKGSLAVFLPYAPKRPYDRASRFAAAGRSSRGRRTSPTVTDAITGTRPSRVRAAGNGRGASAARKSAAAPSKGMPVRSPRRWRKKSSASIEPRVQDRAVVVAVTAISRAGPRPIAASPGRGRVPGSVRATARAKWTVAASGVRHHARRSTAPDGSSGWLIAWPRVHRRRNPVPAEASATRRRRRCTAGRAPRVRRRASTRYGLPSRPSGAGARSSPGVRPGG